MNARAQINETGLAENATTGRVLIAGGSGFLGVSLAHHLVARGHQVTILSRHRPKVNGPWQFVPWDARTLGEWKTSLSGSAGIVNLVGRSVDCIKTPDHIDEILRSRVEATRLLGQAMRAIDAPPPMWVQMATAHIYGDPQVTCDEDSAFGYGLAPFVGRAWEEAFRESLLPSQRGVVLRTGFVLGKNRGAGAGALSRLTMLARLGFGGKIGTGQQGMSWIHETDLNRLFERALFHQEPSGATTHEPAMQGAYIASSPNPVSQVVFMRELRRALRVPIGLPAFGWMVRFGAKWLLRTDPELALYGRYVISRRLREENFAFEFAELKEAFADLFG